MSIVADQKNVLAAGKISLSEPSIVKLPLTPEMVASYTRVDNHLVLRLKDGKRLEIADFFKQGEDGERSELVLEQADGSAYRVQYDAASDAFLAVPVTPAQQAALAQAELASATSSAAALPAAEASSGFNWLIGAFAVLTGAGVAIFRNSGSSSSSSSEDDSGTGGEMPGVPNGSDTEAPGAATDLAFAADGQTLNGKGEAGATVIVRDAQGQPLLDADGQPVTGVVGADGEFSIKITPAPAAGTVIDVVLQDAAGNVSDPSTVTAPGAPNGGDTEAPGAATDLAFAADGQTLNGKGEAGATVIVRDAQGQPLLDADGQPVTGVVGADGEFSIKITPAPAAGTVIDVVLQDAAGNVSDPSTVTAPGAPNGGDTEAPGAATDLAFAADGQTLNGKGEAGATVIVRDAQGQPLLDADGQPVTDVVGADGEFSIKITPAPAAGTVIDVVLQDAAGNVSDPSTVTAPGAPNGGDTEAPGAATDLAFAADGQTLNGKGEAGATVIVRDAQGQPLLDADGQPVTGVVGADGEFSIKITPAPAAGTVIDVVLQDAAGNVSDPSTVTAPGAPNGGDTEAPGAATDLAFAADGQTLNGKGEAGATVIVRDAQGQPLLDADGQPVTGLVGADGEFSIKITPAPAAGTVIDVVLQDAAGNVSDPSTVTAPGAPAQIQANDNHAEAMLWVAAGSKDVSQDPAYAKSDIGVNLLKVNLGPVLGLDILDVDLLTGVPSMNLNVADGQTHQLGLNLKAGGVLGLLTTVNIHIYQELPNGKWAPYETFANKTIGLNLLGLGDTNININDITLPAGNYKVIVEQTGGIGLLDTLKISTTSYVVTDVGATGPENIRADVLNGDLLQDDVVRDSTRLERVNGQLFGADEVLQVQGRYGVLTVQADGKYSYQAYPDVANLGEHDIFVYEIYDPVLEQRSQARLEIEIQGQVVDTLPAVTVDDNIGLTQDAATTDVSEPAPAEVSADDADATWSMLDVLNAAAAPAMAEAETSAQDWALDALAVEAIPLDALLLEPLTPSESLPALADVATEVVQDEADVWQTPAASVSLDELLQHNALVY